MAWLSLISTDEVHRFINVYFEHFSSTFPPRGSRLDVFWGYPFLFCVTLWNKLGGDMWLLSGHPVERRILVFHLQKSCSLCPGFHRWGRWQTETTLFLWWHLVPEIPCFLRLMWCLPYSLLDYRPNCFFVPRLLLKWMKSTAGGLKGTQN